MSRTLTAADRSSLIKLASSMPVGSPERRAILAGLQGSVTKTAGMTPDDLMRVEAEIDEIFDGGG